MRRGNHLGAILGAMALSVGGMPRVAPQRRYYDPGATPIPPRPSPAAKPTVEKFTRQLVRSIRRELTEHSFRRARVQAKSLGWETPADGEQLHAHDEAAWRRIWLAELERAAAATKDGGAHA